MERRRVVRVEDCWWCLEGLGAEGWGLRQDQWTKWVWFQDRLSPHIWAQGALGDVFEAVNPSFLQAVFLPRPGWCTPGQLAVFQPFPLEVVEWKAKCLHYQLLYSCIVLKLMWLWHPFSVSCNCLLYVDIVQKGAREGQRLERSGSSWSCKFRERRLKSWFPLFAK